MTDAARLSYAKALFLLEKESGNIKQTRDEFRQIASFLSVEPEGKELLSVLSSFVLPKERQVTLLKETILSSLSSKHLKALLSLLVSKRMIGDVAKIEEDYRRFANKELGVEEGLVYSATPLTSEQIRKIEGAFEKNLHKVVSLENRIDKRLIGGARVYIGDKMYDSSLEGKMEALRQHLLKGADL